MAGRLKNRGQRSYGKDAEKPEKEQGQRTHGTPQRVRKPRPRGKRGNY